MNVKNFFHTRTSAVVAAAAVFALMTGSLAMAAPGRGDNPNGRPFQDDGATTLDADTHKFGDQAVTIQSGFSGTAQAYCPEGQSAIAGGYEVENDQDPASVHVLKSQPTGDYDTNLMFNGWEVKVHYAADADDDNGFITVQLAVVCAEVQ